VRFSVGPRGLIRSWVRALVCSACRAAQFYGGKVTQARDLTSKLDDDDRDEDREGVYGFESRVARARQFAAEAVLTAYTLMACGRGRGRRLQRHHRREMEILWSRRSPSPPPSAARRRSRDRRLRARRSGRGSQDPRLAAPQFPP